MTYNQDTLYISSQLEKGKEKIIFKTFLLLNLNFEISNVYYLTVEKYIVNPISEQTLPKIGMFVFLN